MKKEESKKIKCHIVINGNLKNIATGFFRDQGLNFSEGISIMLSQIKDHINNTRNKIIENEKEFKNAE